MLEKLFRHRVDAWAALMIVSLFAIQLGLYLFVANIWLMIVATILLVPVRLSVMAYNHNHIHSLTFINTKLNRLLEMMMFFETGQSPFSGTFNHIIGHHATYFEPALDTLNWKRADGSVMTAHEFAFKCMLRHYPSCFFFRKGRKELFRGFLGYLFACLALLLGLIIYNPVAALIIYILPMALMLYMLKLAAHAHHSGLSQEDHFLASRTNTSKFYNWITWNAGYHAAHHFKQALHWSLLPAYHAELAAKIPQELQGEHWGEQLARARMKVKAA